MFRWGIWSCMFSSSCFYFRFNLNTFSLIPRWESSKPTKNPQILFHRDHYQVLSNCMFITFIFCISGVSYTTQGHGLTQRITGISMLFIYPCSLLQAFYIKTCFSNKPVLLFNLPCVLWGCWVFNFLFFNGYEKKGSLILIPIHAIADRQLYIKAAKTVLQALPSHLKLHFLY